MHNITLGFANMSKVSNDGISANCLSVHTKMERFQGNLKFLSLRLTGSSCATKEVREVGRLKQKRHLILSDARQPEVRPFPLKYALTIPNCIARCLLRINILIEMFCPKFDDIYCPRMQKNHFRSTCLAQKRLSLSSRPFTSFVA